MACLVPMDRHRFQALVGDTRVVCLVLMDRHRLEALVTREPRHRLKILVGLEMLDTEMGIWMLDIKEMGMGMLDIKVGIERLDTTVVVGLARSDTM